MTKHGTRCCHTMAGTRCELVAGHQSAHTACAGELMVHWRNDLAPAGRQTHVAFDWAEAANQ